MGKEVNSNAVNLLCEGTMIVGDVNHLTVPIKHHSGFYSQYSRNNITHHPGRCFQRHSSAGSNISHHYPHDINISTLYITFYLCGIPHHQTT